MSSKSCTKLTVPSRGKTPPIPALITPASYFYPILMSDQAFFPLLSKLAVLKSFAKYLAVAQLKYFTVEGTPLQITIRGWKQSIPAECRQHCTVTSPCSPGGSCAGRHPLLPPSIYFPQAQPFQHLLLLLAGKAFAQFALPEVFLQGHLSASLLECLPAEGMQTQVWCCRQGSNSPCLPLSLWGCSREHFLSFLSHRSLVQLIFNSYTHWDNLNWEDEGNLVPGCVGSLLNSCLGRWKTHSHLSLSNQAEMDLKISPIADSSCT